MTVWDIFQSNGEEFYSLNSQEALQLIPLERCMASRPAREWNGSMTWYQLSWPWFLDWVSGRFIECVYRVCELKENLQRFLSIIERFCLLLLHIPAVAEKTQWSWDLFSLSFKRKHPPPSVASFGFLPKLFVRLDNKYEIKSLCWSNLFLNSVFKALHLKALLKQN